MYMFQNRVSPASMSGICLDVCYFGRRRNGWAWWALFELSALQGSLPQYTIVYQRVWHLRFEYVTGLIILVNLVMVGVETGDGLVYSGFSTSFLADGLGSEDYVLLCFRCFLVEQNLGKVQKLYKLWCFHESWVTAYMMCYCYFDEGGKTKLHPNFSKNNRWSSPRKKMVDSPTRNECLVGGFQNMFLFFHNIWDNASHWLIFFTMVKTTNQMLLGNGHRKSINKHQEMFWDSSLIIQNVRYCMT